mgnify:CR=1 FL=1
MTNEFDRMGCRLDGPVIEHKVDGNIISDGMVTGAIQVPTSGLPIIMLAERQTVGGYTKIATVITADLPVIGQCRPGDVIRFQSVTVPHGPPAVAGDAAAAQYSGSKSECSGAPGSAFGPGSPVSRLPRDYPAWSCAPLPHYRQRKVYETSIQVVSQ